MQVKINVPLIDLRAQYLSIKDEIDSAISRVLHKGNYVMGNEVEAFEEEWARVCGAKYCIGVSSGTDALFLSLLALPEGLKDVLTTPATFFATTQAIVGAGKRPKFIDIGDNGNINLRIPTLPGHDIGLVVHLYGLPAYIPASYPNPIIEDSAQAHGLPLRGKLACFSFYPTKNLGAMGQAGAVVTNDEYLARRIREMRTYGERERFVHYEVTGNYRMDELQAAILRAKLPYLHKWNILRGLMARGYLEGLRNLKVIKLPEDNLHHVWHIFSIRTKERDDLVAYLKDWRIQTSVRYPVPMHLQPALRHLGYHEGDFPNAEAWANENLSLPIYPEMPTEHLEYVIEKVIEWASMRPY